MRIQPILRQNQLKLSIDLDERAETGGKAAANQELAFEYSTNQSTWNTPGPTAAWDYAEDKERMEVLLQALQLTDTVTSGGIY